MGKDWHAEGEKDAGKAGRQTSSADIVRDQLFGGSYNPPSDKTSRDAYKSGWDNNKSQNRNK